jgi:hypothetical protein
MPADLPRGMPGIGEEIEGAMQHAPQPGRQFMGRSFAHRAAGGKESNRWRLPGRSICPRR